MAISRDTVIWGYRLLLGREPESEEAIRAHLRLRNETELAEVLLRSPELAASGRFRGLLRSGEPSATAASRAPRVPRHLSHSGAQAVLLGNCQSAPLADLLQAMTGDMSIRSFETTARFLTQLREGALDVREVIEGADLIFVQMVGEVDQWIRQAAPRAADRIRWLPPINYSGFHPDCVYVQLADGSYLRGPMGEYHSSIALWAWRAGLTIDQTLSLFREEVYEELGFLDMHAGARRALVANGRRCDFPMAGLLDRWTDGGCFMHTINHPKVAVLADVAEALLAREGIDAIRQAGAWVEDRLVRWPVWPVYPGVAEPSGLTGDYVFKLDRGHLPASQPVLTLSLEQFVQASFEAFAEGSQRGALVCPRIEGARYQALRQRLGRRTPSQADAGAAQDVARKDSADPAAGQSPYRHMPDRQFWRRAVERVAAQELDPVVTPRFRIARLDRVATAGSCFAQHIARALQQGGFDYMVVDRVAGMPAPEAQRRGFGMFSARYGNLYTARQLVQLFDRAHGDFTPKDRFWRRDDGRWVDPFRPQIEPDGFALQRDVVRAAREHLQDVQRMFAELDVFVFTLGLTECWRRRSDGAVFPLAPGVAGGHFDPELYEFVNFNAAEVASDVRAFMRRLHGVNRKARVILTVSPVPLIATFANRHVLVSTTYSKSVLRAAADEVLKSEPAVDYFPSYEIITGPHARGGYFEDDLRSVRREGVDHVMRVFFRHYTDGTQSTPTPAPAPATEARAGGIDVQAESERLDRVICDEEALDRDTPRA